MSHPFVQCSCMVDAPLPLVAQQPSTLSDRLTRYHSAGVQVTLFYLLMPHSHNFYYNIFQSYFIISRLTHTDLIYILDFIISMSIQEKTQYTQDLVLSTVSGIHWESLNVSLAANERLLNLSEIPMSKSEPPCLLYKLSQGDLICSMT